MALIQDRPFKRHLLDTGSSVTTCLNCQSVAGTGFWEVELDDLESRHVCKVECIKPLHAPLPVQKAAPKEPFADHATKRRYA